MPNRISAIRSFLKKHVLLAIFLIGSIVMVPSFYLAGVVFDMFDLDKTARNLLSFPVIILVGILIGLIFRWIDSADSEQS
jgi:uncharacterized membrane protein